MSEYRLTVLPGDGTVKRLVASDGEAGAALQKHRDSLLTYVFLAQGAFKYEPKAAETYLAKAKDEALAANAAIASLADSLGVVLKPSGE